MVANSSKPAFNILHFLEHIVRADYEEHQNWENLFIALSDHKLWLDQIIKTLKIKKEYSDTHIAEQIFSFPKTKTKETFKYHILSVRKCVDEIENELRQFQKQTKEESNLHREKISSLHSEYIKGKLALLKDLIIDSYEFIGKYEKEFLKRQPTHMLGRRRSFVSNEIFFCSKQLLRRNFYYNDITFSSIPIFLIRQAIETKIVKSLGIHSIIDKNETNLKFKFDKILDFVDANSNIVLPIKKSILKKIFQWTNYYIHSGIMYYHWQTMWAHKMLEPLFDMGQGNTMIKLDGAIHISKAYFEKEFENEILDYLGFEGAQIIKVSPEALIE